MCEQLATDEGEEIVCIGVFLSDKDQQDDYIYKMIIAMLEDERIEALVHKYDSSDEEEEKQKFIRTPSKPYVRLSPD